MTAAAQLKKRPPPLGSAITSQTALLEVASKVSEILRAEYKRGPWPSPNQCYGVAIAIDAVNKKKSPKRDFINTPSFIESRNLIDAMRRLINKKTRTLQEFADNWGGLDGPYAIGIRNLTALESALKQAEGDLLDHPHPDAGHRADGWWHHGARHIAREVRDALLKAGHRKVSPQKGGPFPRAMAALLWCEGVNIVAVAPRAVAAVLSDRF